MFSKLKSKIIQKQVDHCKQQFDIASAYSALVNSGFKDRTIQNVLNSICDYDNIDQISVNNGVYITRTKTGYTIKSLNEV